MLLPLFLLLPLVVSQFIPRLSLDCSRIDPSFCCTSRIRSLCQRECANVQCGPEYYQQLFSTDLNSGNSGSRDGNTRISTPQRERFEEVIEVDSAPPPPFPVPSPVAPQPLAVTSAPPLPGQFPTLIPFEQNIDADNGLRDKDVLWTTTPVAVTKTTPVRRRTTPDPRIIKAPESLIIIGDYDEDPEGMGGLMATANPTEIAIAVLSGLVSSSGGVTVPTSQITREDIERETMLVTQRREMTGNQGLETLPDNQEFHRSAARSIPNGETAPQQRKLKCGMLFGRLSCQSVVNRTAILYRRNFITNRIVMPVRTRKHQQKQKKNKKISKGKPRRGPTWSVSLLRADGSKEPSGVAKVPNFAVDGDAGKLRPKDRITSGIESIINSFSLSTAKSNNMRERSKGTEFENTPFRNKAFGELEIMSGSAQVSRTTARPVIIPTTAFLPFRPLLPIPQVTSGPPQPTCGVAPEFTPCVSSEQASHALADCCRRKNLPAGCLHLCRYDITQAEVRAAMDRGHCGILNVAPFLECAAQGKDNTQCCQYKGVARKTGPQCEQFCRPGGGLSGLGLQHIICGNAIGEMLQCHHSGIRI